MHDFHHHAATAMVQAGVDLHTVSKILGHSTIKLTMRYSHPGFDHTREAVKVLETLGGRKEENQGKDGTDLAQREAQIRTIH
jgi:integrase